MENFVLSMMEKPIIMREYVSQKSSEAFARLEQPEKMLGDAQIYLKGYKHEKDRIAETIRRNQSLDFCPSTNVLNYEFRRRDTSKEIHPEMRFKSKTGLERITQFLRDNTQTQLENINWDKFKITEENLAPGMKYWEYI